MQNGKGIAVGRRFHSQRGTSLLEVVFLILILAFSLPVLTNLLSSALMESVDGDTLTEALFLAQEKMERVLADYRSPGRGYGYVVQATYPPDTTAPGFSRTVSIDTLQSYSGVPYTLLEVTVSVAGLPDVRLSTWITDR